MDSKNNDGVEKLEKSLTWFANAIFNECGMNTQGTFQEVRNKKRKRKKKKKASSSSSLEPGKAVHKEELGDASVDMSSAASEFQQEEQSSQDNRTIDVCPTLTQASNTSAVCDSLPQHLDFDPSCFVNRGDEQCGSALPRQTVDDLLSSPWQKQERHLLPERHQDNNTKSSVPDPSSPREPLNPTPAEAFVPQDRFALSSAQQQHSADPRGYHILPQNTWPPLHTWPPANSGSSAYGYHPSSADMNYYYTPLNWNEFSPVHTWPPPGYPNFGNFGFPIYNPQQGSFPSLDYRAGSTLMSTPSANTPCIFPGGPQHTIPLHSQGPRNFQMSSHKSCQHWRKKH